MSPTREVAIEMYRRMQLIRRFDEAVAQLSKAGEIGGAAHLTLGQEGAVVGACLALRDDDYITGTHRSHGHPIGKGADVRPLMAELLGKSTGVNHGKGGSMHLADFSVGSLGETSIVGAGLPIAVGGGLSARLRNSDQVALCFFGDGAANQGTFHESLNLAAVWKLPVIFLCENNRYALSTPYESTTSIENISDRAVAYGMPGALVDGMDARLVYAAVTDAVARARSGAGPSLIEARTYRFTEHAEGLRLKYRDEPEIEEWRAKDPIALLRKSLIDEAPESLGELEAIDSEVDELILDAVQFARVSPVPMLSSIYDDLYAMPLRRPAG